jgi:enoyl-CoA hydratase/carnithine racemase
MLLLSPPAIDPIATTDRKETIIHEGNDMSEVQESYSAVDAASKDDVVTIDDHGGYAVITLNRPEKRNAMSLEMVRLLREGLESLVDKRAIILTGTGTAFCAGMDLKEQGGVNAWRERVKKEQSRHLHVWTHVQQEIRSHPAIIIAAVNGYALGGGSTLIHSSDLAIAAESAQIGAPEMGFGGFPSQAGPSAAKRLLPKHAAEIVLLARRISGQDAYRMGLVNRVVPDDELMAAALDWAELISGFNPIAIDWGKKTLHAMETLGWDASMDYTMLTNNIMSYRSDHGADGVDAFLSGHRGVGQGK